LVPKVHPATRPAEVEDPFMLHANPVPGDPEVMLRCLVQEYAWMGWGADEIIGLFRDPSYPALNELWHGQGGEWVCRRVAALVGETGVYRVSGTVVDGPEEDEEEDLIELGLPADWKCREPRDS
jgi:hypothetical protein